MIDDNQECPPLSVLSAVSATIPWEEGKEEDFADLREGLRKIREGELIERLNDSDTEGNSDSDDDQEVQTNYGKFQESEDEEDDNDEDPGAGHPERILWAAQHNKLCLAKELLDSCPGLVGTRDSDLYTPLHRASYNNHLEMARLLLHAGADPLATTEDDWTPLHSAAKWNSASVVELLLNYTPVNCTTKGGQTPLHLACLSSNNRETLELLLMQKDLDPSILNAQGDTARDVSKRNSHFYPLFDSVSARAIRKYKE